VQLLEVEQANTGVHMMRQCWLLHHYSVENALTPDRPHSAQMGLRLYLEHCRRPLTRCLRAPMTVLRRLDAVLEDTKQAVLERKAFLDQQGIAAQDGALRAAAGQAFCNTSPFALNTPKNAVMTHFRLAQQVAGKSQDKSV